VDKDKKFFTYGSHKIYMIFLGIANMKQGEYEYFHVHPVTNSLHFVELEGFEPSSKQVAKMISTCLASG
jgi:hypothetical protein